ncbi:Na+/glutamate symporter OS=Ureibacillus acetophenoni OX=614649 GN=SAMN05877842_1202 PE=4 SV=1 [Ureibacillus acetophenoni]
MAQMVAIVILLFILYIGDFISIRTKAWIPSIFISAVLFLIGYWTFFPKDIVAIAGIPNTVATLLIYLLIVNMGTLLSIKELIAQWKTVVISLAGILGIIVLLFGVASFIFDMNTVIVAIPPLVGGIVSALIMSEGATQAGLTSLAVFAIVIYVMQGFAGYPLTSIVLKKEGKRLLQKYRNGELEIKSEAQKVEETTEKKHGLKIFQVPEKYNTEYFKFFKIAVVGCLAYLTSVTLAPIVEINGAVLCLVFGVIAKSIGFLETHVLQKANGFGFAIMALMLFVFDALKNATPSMLLDLLTPLVVCITLGVIGMYIFSFIAGKLLKVSKNLAFAVSLTALYGFPADYVITNEVIKALTTDEKERAALTQHMLPPMLVGGFVSVTIVSVILAGIFVTFL